MSDKHIYELKFLSHFFILRPQIFSFFGIPNRELSGNPINLFRRKYKTKFLFLMQIANH